MKLPHYVLLVLSLLIVIATWLLAQNSSGALAEPATVVAAISTLLTILKTIVGMSTDSVQTSMRAKRALASMATKCIWILPLALLVLACGAASLIPQQVSDSVALEQCIQSNWGKPFLTVVATCAANEEQLVADAIADVIALADEQADGGVVPNPYASEPKVAAALARRASVAR